MTGRAASSPSRCRPRSCGCPPGSGSSPSRWSLLRCGRRCAGRCHDRGGPMTAALRFNNLTLGYDRHPAVHHLDGTVETGALIAIIGPNGAGKSTLFKGIVGALKPLAGRIDRNGLNVRDIAYLPQIAELDRSFPIHVYDLVVMGLWRRSGLFGGFRRGDYAKIGEAIAA